ncbi:aspartate--tRNA ligase [Candidatus Pelagibacter sp.]|nr:aspartate--tRNA ligase [Candidatus Pelagibacter sp.]
MTKYRTHTCDELNIKNEGEKVLLSGWVNKKRDHGNLLFIDLRDNYGVTQCVIDKKNDLFKKIEKIPLETVIQFEGQVIKRDKGTINKELNTGEIEIKIINFKILGTTKELPLPVFSDQEYSEEIRLKYRFLDLRRSKIHKNINLRSKVISFIRKEMENLGFLEYQTPILTSSSPEGARDFLVPSRLNPGKFYALPQAPQQFKQLIMVSGFDKYFQIAPCFRDEDARADRSPGEFYQLDIEMSFVDQNDIFNVVEKLLNNLFKKFSNKKILNEKFPKIPFSDSMLKYGTDKPDLRNPLEICDLTKIFERNDVKFEIFNKLVKKGSIVRAIVTKKTSNKPRSFFDNLDKWAKNEGSSGLAYFTFEKENNKVFGKGPIGKLFSSEACEEIMKISKAEIGDSIFFACANKKEVEKLLSVARDKIARDLGIIDKNTFAFCWLIDYPMYETDEKSGKIKFSHNPFSMPQGDLNDLNLEKPLSIKAYQYDIVCNGIELSSGAIRNHIPELMYKLFSVAGYDKKSVDQKFSGMINALSYGAPPHGGIAPGIDRIVMLLANEKNIREVTMFPMNQNAQDLLMNAPSNVDESQLKELNINLIKKK